MNGRFADRFLQAPHGIRLFASAALGAGFVGAVGADPSMGAQINYGTHAGEHVTFVNVTEDSGADEPLPLFGPPTVSGDSMDFSGIL